MGIVGVRLVGSASGSSFSLTSSVDVASMGSVSVQRERSNDGSELVFSVSLGSDGRGSNWSSGTVSGSSVTLKMTI